MLSAKCKVNQSIQSGCSNTWDGQIEEHQRHTRTNRQRDKQTDRQTDRQTNRQTDRQTDRQTNGQKERQTDRQKQKHQGHTGAVLNIAIPPLLCKSFLVILFGIHAIAHLLGQIEEKYDQCTPKSKHLKCQLGPPVTHCSGHVKSSKQKQWLSHFLEVERHKCTWRQLRSSEDSIFDRHSTWFEFLWQGFLSTLRQAFSLHLILNQNLFDTFYSFYTFWSGVAQ